MKQRNAVSQASRSYGTLKSYSIIAWRGASCHRLLQFVSTCLEAFRNTRTDVRRGQVSSCTSAFSLTKHLSLDAGTQQISEDCETGHLVVQTSSYPFSPRLDRPADSPKQLASAHSTPGDHVATCTNCGMYNARSPRLSASLFPRHQHAVPD